MLRLASDADVHGDIIRGLRRRLPEIDLVRVQDALPEGTLDPEVLAWAAAENRVLITNDRNTMVGFAYLFASTLLVGGLGNGYDRGIMTALAADDAGHVNICLPSRGSPVKGIIHKL